MEEQYPDEVFEIIKKQIDDLHKFIAGQLGATPGQDYIDTESVVYWVATCRTWAHIVEQNLMEQIEGGEGTVH
jgi:hypothetical protein